MAMTAAPMSTDDEAEQHLMELLADMSDDEVADLGAEAEAMHGEGGDAA